MKSGLAIFSSANQDNPEFLQANERVYPPPPLPPHHYHPTTTTTIFTTTTTTTTVCTVVLMVVEAVVVSLRTTKRCAFLRPSSDEPNIGNTAGTTPIPMGRFGEHSCSAGRVSRRADIGQRAAASALLLVCQLLLLCPISYWAAAAGATVPAAAAAAAAAVGVSHFAAEYSEETAIYDL